MLTLFVKHLINLDASFIHKTRGIVGESWIVDLHISGVTNDQGMILDFGDIKSRLKSAIEDIFDHKLIIPEYLDGLTIVEDELTTVTWEDNNGHKYRYQCPPCALYVVESDQITNEELEQAILEHILMLFPDNAEKIHISLRHEAIEGPYYQYSHGLKKHQGACQRMVHGHRSKLEIYEDDRRNTRLENHWARRFRDIYLGSEEDLAEVIAEGDVQYCHFAYTAEEGDFELTLPANKCNLLPYESTVENIADFIAKQIPSNATHIHAFEGINKGAIALRPEG